MKRELADSRACDDELDARIGDLLEDLKMHTHQQVCLLGHASAAQELTFSMCFSSPVVKFNISSAVFSKTVPFVSVCAISNPDVYTATFAFVSFFTTPGNYSLSTH